jgi:cystathionine beta-lyase/cystathionine gamma-synthase
VGIESIDDLLSDLEHALQAVGEPVAVRVG